MESDVLTKSGRLIHVLILLYLTASMVKVFVSLPFKMPFVWGDAYLYTDLARNFVQSGIPLSRNLFGPSYPPLYSIVISPAYLLAVPTELSYHIILVINAFISTSVVFPVYLMLARTFGRTPVSLALSAGVVLLPPLFGYSFSVMAENLFIPLVIWLIYFVYDFDGTDTGKSALVGLVIAALILTKSVGFAFLPAMLFLVLVSLWSSLDSQLRRIRSSAVLVVSTLLPVFLWARVEAYLQQRHPNRFGEDYAPDQYLEQVYRVMNEPDHFYLFLQILANQMVYLVFATYGLSLAALVYLGSELVWKRSRIPFAGFVLLGTAGLVLTSTLHSVLYYSADPGRYTMMPRYLDCILPVLMILGIQYLVTHSTAASRSRFLILLGCLLLAAWFTPAVEFGIISRMGMTYVTLFARYVPLPFFLIALSLVLAWMLSNLRHKLVRFSFVVLASLLSVTACLHLYISELKYSRLLSKQMILAEYVRKEIPNDKVPILLDFSSCPVNTEKFRLFVWRFIYHTGKHPILVTSMKDIAGHAYDGSVAIIRCGEAPFDPVPLEVEDAIALYMVDGGQVEEFFESR